MSDGEGFRRTPASRGRPANKQRYAARRFLAIAVVGLVAFGIFRGVQALSNGRPTAIEPAATSAVTIASPSSVILDAAVAAPREDGDPEGSAVANPVVVLIMGDSNAGTFGPYVQSLVEESGVVDVRLDYTASTGLSRPDAYNWPQHIRDSLVEHDPDIVVVTFGGNDAQGLTAPCSNGADTCELEVVVAQANENNAAEWRDEYSQRVTDVLDIILGDPDRKVIWVGIPNAADAALTERLRIQDQAVREALAGYDDVVFVDTWDRFDGLNGGIAELIVDPRDGEAKPVRQSDGFHLNEDGAEILAIDIDAEIQQMLDRLGVER